MFISIFCLYLVYENTINNKTMKEHHSNLDVFNNGQLEQYYFTNLEEAINYQTKNSKKMITQLNDLKKQLKQAEYNIKYCEWKGIQGTPLHKAFINRMQK